MITETSLGPNPDSFASACMPTVHQETLGKCISKLSVAAPGILSWKGDKG